jgi:hypothetical protein
MFDIGSKKTLRRRFCSRFNHFFQVHETWSEKIAKTAVDSGARLNASSREPWQKVGGEIGFRYLL